jgi:hypothetical protein
MKEDLSFNVLVQAHIDACFKFLNTDTANSTDSEEWRQVMATREAMTNQVFDRYGKREVTNEERKFLEPYLVGSVNGAIFGLVRKIVKQKYGERS